MSLSRDLFVLPPRLPAAQKKLYNPSNETSLSEILVNEVIGEYREGNVLYYYARYDGGIAHRVRVFLRPFEISIIFTRLD
jgi:chromodomain-helicase-DNA-binding protein 4